MCVVWGCSYIFTCLNPITRYLFPEADDKLLKYLEEDGQSIQPEFYLPILPTILVNGASGIGTGWSTDVPCYNPRDIAENIKRMIRGAEPVAMKPWYENFKVRPPSLRCPARLLVSYFEHRREK